MVNICKKLGCSYCNMNGSYIYCNLLKKLVFNTDRITNTYLDYYTNWSYLKCPIVGKLKILLKWYK